MLKKILDYASYKPEIYEMSTSKFWDDEHISKGMLDSIECYNLWDHTFTKTELEEDLQKAGFTTGDFYGDVAGDVYIPDGNLMCAVANKKGRI